jgi:hypothetical protein
MRRMRAVLVATLCMIFACMTSTTSSLPSSGYRPQPAQPGPTTDPTPTPKPTSGRADGAACNASDECASGICEGEGCGDNQGTCAPKARGCTRDLRQYCGCDGKTFQASGSCPGQRFSKRDAC